MGLQLGHERVGYQSRSQAKCVRVLCNVQLQLVQRAHQCECHNFELIPILGGKRLLHIHCHNVAIRLG